MPMGFRRKLSIRETSIYFYSSYAWLHLNVAFFLPFGEKALRIFNLYLNWFISHPHAAWEKKSGPVAPPKIKEINKNEWKTRKSTQAQLKYGHMANNTSNRIGRGFQDSKTLCTYWKEIKSSEWGKKEDQQLRKSARVLIIQLTQVFLSC